MSKNVNKTAKQRVIDFYPQAFCKGFFVGSIKTMVFRVLTKPEDLGGYVLAGGPTAALAWKFALKKISELKVVK